MITIDRRARNLTLAGLCLALFMTLLDATVVNLALPDIADDLGVRLTGQQWIVDAYILVFASLLLSAGALGDRWGRRRVFIAGMAAFCAGSLVCALAPGLPVLIVGRMVQGVGAAALLPGTMALLAAAFPDERDRARAIGVWSGTSGLALLLGPPVGGALVRYIGWPAIFYLNLPLGAVAITLAFRVFPEARDGLRGPGGATRNPLTTDPAGQGLAIITLAALTYALIEGRRSGWGSPLIAGLLVVAAAAFAGLLVAESRAAEPVLPLGLFAVPRFAAATAVIFLVGFGLLGSFFYLSLFFQQVQHHSAAEAGARVLPVMAAVVVAAPAAGRLAGRSGSRGPMTAGLVSAGIGLLGLSTVGAHTAYAATWPLLVLFGLGLGLTMSPTNAAIVGAVPPRQAGLASAVGMTGQQVGSLIGVALLGSMAGADLGGGTRRGAGGAAFVDGMHRAFLIAGLAYLAGAVIALAFVRDTAPRTRAARPAGDAGFRGRP